MAKKIRTKDKYKSKNPVNTKINKKKRQGKWKKDRERWKNDKEYQKKQAERAKKLGRDENGTR